MRSSGRHRSGTGETGGGGRERGRETRTAEDRCCSRNGCTEPALATLTYIYAASTAVVGPLASYPEPHTYDLCAAHAHSLTAPRGWELVRHDGELTAPPPRPDDLTALAEAVREARHPDGTAPPGAGAGPPGPGAGAGPPGDPPRSRGRAGHLRVVPPA